MSQPPQGPGVPPPPGQPYGNQPPYGGQPAGQPYGQPAPAGPPISDSDRKTWGMLAHLLGIFSWLGPLIVWLMYKDKDQFVGEEAKEALNFQITWWVIGIPTCGIGMLVGFVFAIIAGISANGHPGQPYRYFWAFRLIK